MLSRRQITAAPTEELEQLRERIKTELERRAWEAEQRRQHAKRVRDRGLLDQTTVLETIETPEGSYQWQMRECGHKDRCRKCKNGERHGPYLYCYYYENGQRKSAYIPLAQAAKWGLERPQALDKISEADAELGPSMIRFLKDKDEIRKEIGRLRRRARDQVRKYERFGVRVPDNHQRISEAYTREADAWAERLRHLD
jgi:hypothetical protein